MVNGILLGITIILFIAILIVFSREQLDYVAFSLLFALIACIATTILIPLDTAAAHFEWINPSQLDSITWLLIFINTIKFEPLMFILGMQIIVVIAEEYKIFQWVAVKSLHITQGDRRKFFYMICTIATITASMIADVTVAVIFVPLVIRACKILNINPSPYLYGITITINIGSVFTPFSSSKNILISHEFGLSFSWFITNLGGFMVFALISTLVLLDVFVLRKYPPPLEERKQIFLEIMNPKLVIKDQTRFTLNFIYLGLIILGFSFFSEFSPYIAFFGGILMALMNGIPFVETIKKIDLKVIFFFIALFLLIGAMEINDTFLLIADGLAFFDMSNAFMVALGVLLVSSFFSGFLASNPTAVLLIIILRSLFPGDVPSIVLVAFLLGINLGGNLLPQGATCDLMTLNLAKKHKVEGFTYRTLLKTGGLFALFHIVLCILYLVIFALIF